MARACIFLNGNLTNTTFVKQHIHEGDHLIAVDGGVIHAMALGVIPNVIIGDLDSISQEIQNKLSTLGIEWISYPPEKDYTDSELAIKYALDKGYDTIRVFGVLGDRVDHFMGNVFLIATLPGGNDIMFIEGNEEIYFVRDHRKIYGQSGDILSLLPVQGDCDGVTISNVKYPLNNETLRYGQTRGISNELTGSEVDLTVKKGLLMVIRTFKSSASHTVQGRQ